MTLSCNGALEIVCAILSYTITIVAEFVKRVA